MLRSEQRAIGALKCHCRQPSSSWHPKPIRRSTVPRVRTPQVDLTVVGVANYAEAERVAKSMVEQGIAAIELCGGFGTARCGADRAAVAGRLPSVSCASMAIPASAARAVTPCSLPRTP